MSAARGSTEPGGIGRGDHGGAGIGDDGGRERVVHSLWLHNTIGPVVAETALSGASGKFIKETRASFALYGGGTTTADVQRTNRMHH